MKLLPALFLLPTTVFASSSFEANLFVDLAKKSVPSVVNISTLGTPRTKFGNMPRGNDLFRKFFEDFFRGQVPGDRDQDEDAPYGEPPSSGSPGAQTMALGTGFIIDPSGLILTNNHVIAGAEEIKISFTEDDQEKPTDGEIVGRDPELDLALIKVKTNRSLTPLPFGDSDSLQVGEFVMAIGNPFGQGHTVTHGIISAKGRKSPDFVLANYIQTDTPINPGNSGGPLINLKGEVIGINNAIDARAQGIGFAIPVNSVKSILPQLKSKGKVQRGYIGVEVTELTPEIANQIRAPKDLKAPLINHVVKDEPAEKAGLKPYDLILSVQGKTVRTAAELIQTITAINPGEQITLKVLRNGKELELPIKIGARPLPPQFAAETGKAKKKKSQPRIETGMVIEEVTSEDLKDLGLSEKTKGVLVTQVSFNSPADRAGIIRGDIILEVDRKPVHSVDAFNHVVTSQKSYLLRVLRAHPQGGEVFLVVVLDLKK